MNLKSKQKEEKVMKDKLMKLAKETERLAEEAEKRAEYSYETWKAYLALLQRLMSGTRVGLCFCSCTESEFKAFLQKFLEVLEIIEVPPEELILENRDRRRTWLVARMLLKPPEMIGVPAEELVLEDGELQEAWLIAREAGWPLTGCLCLRDLADALVAYFTRKREALTDEKKKPR